MDNKETKKEHHEWLLVRRSKKTGKSIRSVSLDFDSEDILSQVKNASNFVCLAVKERWRRLQESKPYLTIAEEEFWSKVHSFFVQRFTFDSKKWFPEILTAELSTEIFDTSEEGLNWELEQGLYQEQIAQVKAALRLIREARKDQDYWRKLYAKFRLYWEWYKNAPYEKGRLKE